ncbi:MAG: histidine kinase [Bacteroidota bacterium]|nr:histidine kinase [Bacteroidota bacterium]
MPKSSSQKDLSNNLVKLYILALSAVALFSIISQILVQYSIAQQQNDARVVNIAGRQRMLSQKLCKTAILIVEPKVFMADAEYYYQDISEIIELWEKCHYGLKNGLLKLENDVPVNNSAKIDSMFNKIEPIFLKLITNAKIINSQTVNPTTLKSDEVKQSLNQMLQNERTFLKMMDKIVFQYDSEAKERVGNLKTIELWLFLLTIIILILEGIFIFRPTYKQINDTIDEIKASEQNQKDLNEQLNLVNDSLFRARYELLEATEEKYKLLMKEDKIRSVSLIEGQEDERKRLSIELHDGLGQMLTGLKLISEKLNENTFEHEKDRKTFNDLKQLLNETIAETRTISFNLMPTVLNDFGIISAIKLLSEQTEKNATISIKFTHNLEEKRLPKNIEITIYRIAQEAINNIIKHANASEIEINLMLIDKIIHLSINDNGKGFDIRRKNNKKIQNGINNMRSRTEINEGEFKIISNVGRGTKINVSIPLK